MTTIKTGTNWASGAYAQRNLPVLDHGTQFDDMVFDLGLEKRPDLWPHSERLRAFAQANRNKRYVPENLLEQWGMDVLIDL